MEDFIASRPPGSPDDLSILPQAKVQTVYRRTRALAEHARKNAGRINSSVEVASTAHGGDSDAAVPTPAPETPIVPDLKDLIAQVKQPDARVKKATKGNPRQSNGLQQRDKKSVMRFKWTGGCFHCGGGHQRMAYPAFKEILRKGNVGKKEADWK